MVRITPIDENRFLGDTFETVSKNLKASDYELTYNGAGDLTVITYANGIIKTLGYLESGDLGTITLSGATPSGITLVKSLEYSESGDLIAVTYA
jgi:YD repeat-containing protein